MEQLKQIDPLAVGIGLLRWILFTLLARSLKKRLPPQPPGMLFEGLLLFAVSFLMHQLFLIGVREAFGSGEETKFVFPLPLYFMTGSLGFFCPVAVGVVAFIKGRKGLGAMGFTLRKSWIILGLVPVMYIAFLPLYALVCFLVNELIMPFEYQEIVKSMRSNPEYFTSIPVIACTALLIPVFEEVLFRGLLLTGLRAFTGNWPAVILSAGIFASLHDTQAMIPVFFLGGLLGYMKVRTGSLYAPMVLHVLHNSLMLLCLPHMIGPA
jgi:membrane protease YdiL (CAAX protease family)